MYQQRQQWRRCCGYDTKQSITKMCTDIWRNVWETKLQNKIYIEITWIESYMWAFPLKLEMEMETARYRIELFPSMWINTEVKVYFHKLIATIYSNWYHEIFSDVDECGSIRNRLRLRTSNLLHIGIINFNNTSAKKTNFLPTHHRHKWSEKPTLFSNVSHNLSLKPGLIDICYIEQNTTNWQFV